MITTSAIEKFIVKQLSMICHEPENTFSADTQLVGEHRSIKSVELVELLLKIEEYVEENFNNEFNWSDNSAMSETRSVLRTVGTLAKHVAELNSENG